MADQYKIPQNIDIEDKIFGPLTLKQFLYAMGGGIIVYILFNIFGQSDFGMFIIISLPIAILTLALIFVKVNERPFIDFIFYFADYSRSSKIRKWDKSAKIKMENIKTKITEEEKGLQKELEKDAKRGIVKSRLNELATILDTSGWSIDNKSDNLKGRISSSKNLGQTNFKEKMRDDTLEDVFEDLEKAFDKLNAK